MRRARPSPLFPYRDVPGRHLVRYRTRTPSPIAAPLEVVDRPSDHPFHRFGKLLFARQSCRRRVSPSEVRATIPPIVDQDGTPLPAPVTRGRCMPTAITPASELGRASDPPLDRFVGRQHRQTGRGKGRYSRPPFPCPWRLRDSALCVSPRNADHPKPGAGRDRVPPDKLAHRPRARPRALEAGRLPETIARFRPRSGRPGLPEHAREDDAETP